tara:strand:- start:86 stop:460 length:375 start_codon:yes stop_codon:yes gene_type:complete
MTSTKHYLIIAGIILLVILAYLFLGPLRGETLKEALKRIDKLKKDNLDKVHKNDIELAKNEVKERTSRMQYEANRQKEAKAILEIEKKMKHKDEEIQGMFDKVRASMDSGNYKEAAKIAGIDLK